jgi:SAM-dependent methyltransferase
MSDYWKRHEAKMYSQNGEDGVIWHLLSQIKGVLPYAVEIGVNEQGKCLEGNTISLFDHHRQILAEVIKPSDKVLDVGCGWGRLLSLMPSDWTGAYIGVDLCPDFIATAARTHQDRRFHFVCGDIRWWDRSWGLNAVIKMDWAVLISIRPMVLRNAGELAWREIEAVLKLTCRSVLYLEYDEKAPGEVEHYT